MQTTIARHLSIIIVNWNSLRYLRECIESIEASTNEADYEIVVVDNASSGDDVSKLREEFPEITVIASEKNLGFAGANNLGFQYSSARFLLFLNPDTKILGSAIDIMLDLFEILPEAGIIGCKLLNSDGTIQMSCVQRYPTIVNQLMDMDVLQRYWPKWKIWGNASLLSESVHPVEVEVVSGACLMIQREAFERIGMFDQSYFMYAEDVDLCYRVRKLGRKVYSTNEAVVVHHGGGTSRRSKGNAWVAIMQRQAILKFCRNTRGHKYAQLYRLSMGMIAILRLVVLMATFPFAPSVKKDEIARFSSIKWLGVLRWSLGLDRRLVELVENV